MLEDRHARTVPEVIISKEIGAVRSHRGGLRAVNEERGPAPDLLEHSCSYRRYFCHWEGIPSGRVCRRGDHSGDHRALELLFFLKRRFRVGVCPINSLSRNDPVNNCGRRRQRLHRCGGSPGRFAKRPGKRLACPEAMGTHTFCILKCVPLLSSRGAWKIVTGNTKMRAPCSWQLSR